MNISKQDEERFWSYVDKSRGPDAPWLWVGQLDRDGYGVVSINGRKQRAHRVSYYLEYGELPEVVRHKNDVRQDVNAAHLEGGTQLDNIRDRQRRDRQAKGIRNGRARLSPDDVRSIRQRYQEGGVTYRKLARDYAVDHTTIGQIIRRETWQHL